MRARSFFLGSIATIAVMSGYACGGASDNSGASGTQGTASGTGGAGAASASTGSSAGGAGGTGGCFGNCHGAIKSLAVSPAAATIDVTNGAGAPAAFQAIATYDDGTTSPVAAAWVFDRPDLGLASNS